MKRKNKQAQSIIVSLLVSLEIQRDKGTDGSKLLFPPVG